MKPLTAEEIRSSIVNAGPAEIAAMPLPGLHEVLWDEREFLGWLDPSTRRRGFLVHWDGDRPVGVMLRSVEPRKGAATAAICSLCRTQQPYTQVVLFTAARAGEAGENGNTVGNYICADLACSMIIRITPGQSTMHPSDLVRQRSERLTERVHGFTGEIRRIP